MHMSNLTTDDVMHVAKLAQLKLTKEEIEKYKEQLSNVLNYFDELNEVDTKGTDPTSQTTGLVNVMRQDEIDATHVLSVADATSGTDKIKNDYFVVPAILDKNS